MRSVVEIWAWKGGLGELGMRNTVYHWWISSLLSYIDDGRYNCNFCAPSFW